MRKKVKGVPVLEQEYIRNSVLLERRQAAAKGTLSKIRTPATDNLRLRQQRREELAKEKGVLPTVKQSKMGGV